MEDARRKREARGEGERGGRYVSTGYAGTLTPPDYPMNRNVIYGSFSELEGWRESRVDRAIIYNTSRHIAIPKLILGACYADAILLYVISLLRNYIYYVNVFAIYLTHPITFTLHRDPRMSVICEFYRDEGSNVHSVSSAIFITRDTGARFRYAMYACASACTSACVRVCVRR